MSNRAHGWRAQGPWAWLAYVVLVILGGAYVRATGSGAGCGDAWPHCGAALEAGPLSRSTLIELSHRALSGVAWLGALLIWRLSVRRARAGGATPPLKQLRRYARLAFVFMSTEALIGAGIVLLELVASNVSVARAYWMAAHLMNTYLLLWATAAWATLWQAAPEADGVLPSAPWQRPRLALTLLALLVSASGAVAALGDTLLLAPGAVYVDQDALVLLKLTALRIWHPVTALIGALAWAIWALRRIRMQRHAALMMLGLLAIQLLVGLANVALKAPVGLQLLHLGVADAIWLCYCLASMSPAPAAPGAREAARPAGDVAVSEAVLPVA